jgi:hypothetical protein
VHACGPSLDSALFSNAAGVADERPPGLLNGTTPLTPAAAGAKESALVDDLAALATAISVVAGNGGIAVIAAPAQSVAIALRLAQPVPYALLTSASLPARTVIAIALNAVVSAMASSLTIDASQAAAVDEFSPAAPHVSLVRPSNDGLRPPGGVPKLFAPRIECQQT